MNEKHATTVSLLMDELLKRLDFDIKNQPPQHLPAITEAVVHLNAFQYGSLNNEERHIAEINLIKNINRQVKDFSGRDNGSNKGKI